MSAPSPRALAEAWERHPAAMAAQRIRVDFTHAEKQRHFVYRMVRPETYERLRAQDCNDRERFVVPFLLATLVSWDVTDRHGNPVRLNHRVLGAQPDDLLIAVMIALNEDFMRLAAQQSGGRP